jgi:hypothetical protein
MEFLRTHGPRSWFSRLIVAGCLAAGLVAPQASGAAGWSHPTNVSGVVSIGEEAPLLNVDSAGNATVVWQRYRGGKLGYESAARQAGGPWSTPARFFGGLEDAYGLRIAVDALGNETAVWERHLGRSWVVQSATRSGGGSWSVPVTLSAAGADSALVAVGPEGNVTAVWLLVREEGWRSVVQSATRSPEGIWSAPVSLSAPRKAARSPQIALDPQGGATVVWEEDFTGAIESSTRSSAGTWSAPVSISARGVGGAWPQVAVDSQGNATAVWAGAINSGSRGREYRIQTASRPPGGSWSAPVSISKPGHRHVQDPQIAVDPQGEATAIWQRSNGSYLVVQGASRTAGGGWSKPVDITTGPGRGGQHLQLAMDPWGTATAIWEGYDAPGPHFAIQAAKHPPAGRWSRPTDISRWTSGLGEPQLAVDPQGRATAIWSIGVKGGSVIQSAGSVSPRGT